MSRRRKASRPQLEPKAPASFVLRGIPYAVDWTKLQPGGSFFIKTTARAQEMKPTLDLMRKIMGFELKAHNRCEFGYYGIRVWRLA